MEYLFFRGDILREKLKNKQVFIFLDYDGTLTPIAGHPGEAKVSPRVKSLLRALSKIPTCKLAVISGRALKDVKQMVGVPGIIYVGNHGLEAAGPGIRFRRRVSPRFRKLLRRIKHELTRQLAAIKGVFIEDKGLGLSIHYRMACRKNVPLLKRIFFKILRGLSVRENIKIKPGKKVYEMVQPLDWHKGKIVKWFLRRQQYLWRGKSIVPIYIGDDKTDEDAFNVLRGKGMTIFVGRPRKSLAQYYLEDTREVERVLGQLLNVLQPIYQ